MSLYSTLLKLTDCRFCMQARYMGYEGGAYGVYEDYMKQRDSKSCQSCNRAELEALGADL